MNGRDKTLRSFFALWREHHPTSSRDERLAWASEKLGRGVESLSALDDQSLRRLVWLLRAESGDGAEANNVVKGAFGRRAADAADDDPLADFFAPPAPAGGGTVTHLATPRQRWLVERLFRWLGYDAGQARQFLESKARVKRVADLTAANADRVIPILLTIAANRLLREEGVAPPYSRRQLRARHADIRRLVGDHRGEVRHADTV